MTDGRLYLPTSRGRVIALDAATGKVLWRFDSGLDPRLQYLEGLTTRGVAVWRDPAASRASDCATRVLSTFVDGSLQAIDAETGQPCSAFGSGGRIDLRDGVSLRSDSLHERDFSITSPPITVRDVIVVGSTIDGNRFPPVASGIVRAYDVRTGALRWSFDPIPREPGHPAWDDWDRSIPVSARGGGNAWAPLTADEELGYVYLPTSSAAPAHIGIERPGSNTLTNSIVAIEASSGRLVWAFQLVRHDLWDYDVATQPVLTSLDLGGERRRVIMAMSKAGHAFVLDARNGDVLSRLEEFDVPPSSLSREHASARQLRGVGVESLGGGHLTRDSIGGATAADRRFCLEWWDRSAYQGPFTPPSEKGSIVWPGVWGGPNWDGVSFDPATSVLFVTVRRIATVVQLLRRDTSATLPPLMAGEQRFQHSSDSLIVRRTPFVAPSGVPCTPPPWGFVAAIQLPSGQRVWHRELGDLVPASWGPTPWRGGSLVFGGPLSTAGGVVFVAASHDDSIRAVRSTDGRVLWSHKLPAGGQAAPITYVIDGIQYVVIIAGGRAGVGSRGDYVVAFSLGGRTTRLR